MPTNSDNIMLQLELLEYLTNGLVLTEALRTNLTKISEITTYLLIIGQIGKDDQDWINVLEESEADPSEVNQTFSEIKPLQDAIENRVSIFNTSEVAIDKILEIAGSIRPIIKTTEAVDLLKLAIDKYSKGGAIPLSDYEPGIKLILKAPSGMEIFANLSQGNDISEGVDVLLKLKEDKIYEKLEDTIKTCKSYNNIKNQNIANLQKCFRNIKTIFMSFSFDATASDHHKLLHNMLNFLSSTVFEADMIEKVIEKEPEFSLLGTNISMISRQLENINLTDDIGWLNESVETSSILTGLLDSVVSPLGLLMPMEKIIEQVENGTKSNFTSSVKYLFKSYYSLPEGINSLDALIKSIGSSQKGSRIFLPGVVERVRKIEEFVAFLDPIAQNSLGIRKIENLLNIMEEVKKLVSSKSIPSDLKNQLIEDIVASSSLWNIADTASFLQKFSEYLKLLKSNNFVEDLRSIRQKFTDEDRKTLKEIGIWLKLLPNFVGYFSKLRTIAESVKASDDIKTLKKHYEALNQVFRKFPKVLENVKKLEDSIKKSRIGKDKVKEVIGKIANLSNVKNNFSDYNFPNSTDSGKDVNTAISVQKWLNKLISNENKTDSFYTKIDFFNNLTKLAMDPGEIQITKNLFDGFSKIEKTKVEMNESARIEKLMSGSPFGSAILEPFYLGVTAYRKIFEEIGSAQILKTSIGMLKSTNRALGGKVQKLLAGFEKLQIPPTFMDLNIFDILANSEKLAVYLRKLSSWIGGIDRNEKVRIEQELVGWMVAHNRTKRQIPNNVQAIHHFVSSLNSQSAQNINRLSTAIRTLFSALSNVDCDKNPSHSICPTPPYAAEKSGISDKKEDDEGGIPVWIFAIIGILCLGLVVGALFGISRYLRNKKNPEKRGPIKLHKRDKAIRVMVDMMKTKQTEWTVFAPQGGTYTYFSLANDVRKQKNLGEMFVDNCYFMAICLQYDALKPFSLKGDKKGLNLMRVGNIPLYKHNRVTNNDEQVHTYIHCSDIRCLGKQKWLAMQAPMDGPEPYYGNSAFYQIMDGEGDKPRPTVVIQLCIDNERDNGPITFTKVHKNHRFSVKPLSSTKNGDVIHTKVEWTRNSVLRKYTYDHLHYTGWKDKHAPKDPEPVLQLIETALKLANGNPIVVMCEDGFGRSMTLIGVALLVSLLKDGKCIQLVDAMNALREERYGACETTVQLAFIELCGAKFIANTSSPENKNKNEQDYAELKKMFDITYDHLFAQPYGFKGTPQKLKEKPRFERKELILKNHSPVTTGQSPKKEIELPPEADEDKNDDILSQTAVSSVEAVKAPSTEEPKKEDSEEGDGE